MGETSRREPGHGERSVPNVFDDLPAGRLEAERCRTLLASGTMRLERIVSTGQVTPPGQWYDQDEDEWVLVLRGGARLRFEDDAEPLELRAGDHVVIPARRRHRVEWTEPDRPTVWLALHYRGPGQGAGGDGPPATGPAAIPRATT